MGTTDSVSRMTMAQNLVNIHAALRIFCRTRSLWEQHVVFPLQLRKC